jgi:uncharacterized protein (UPF0332 family)
LVVTPLDFLVHARKINNSSAPPEIDCRSAVSRAYYSLFHEALNFLEAKGKYKRTGKGDHNNVKNILLKLDCSVGLDYNQFRDDRTQADYQLKTNFYSQADVTIKLNLIQVLITRIKALNP